MLPSERVPTHPGEILKEEFLDPLDLTQVALAAHIGVPVQRINEIIRGKRGITPETAWLLAQALGTTAQFWVNLQANYDLASARPRKTISRLRKAGKPPGEAAGKTCHASGSGFGGPWHRPWLRQVRASSRRSFPGASGDTRYRYWRDKKR